MKKFKQRPGHTISVKLYELNSVRNISIDLNNSRDRSKLKHILQYDAHRLRKRDLDRYTTLLSQTKLR